MSVKRIAVLGGTGFLGRAVCEHLSRRSTGCAIVVPTRRAMHANAVRALPTVDVRVADVHDDAALAGVLAGCDAVINLIAILHGDAAAFAQVHARLPERMAATCAAAGIRRVLHVSALGVSDDAPSNYLRSKAAGESALRAAPLALTVLRPSLIFGAQDRLLNLFAGLQALAPLMPLAGGAAQLQPVWVNDVAEAIVRCLDTPATIGQTIECAGPEVVTLAELVRLAGRWSGHPRPVLALPPAVGHLQAWLMERLPGPPLLSRDNLASLRIPNVAGGKLPGLASLGIEAAAMASVVPGYLQAGESAAERLDRWRKAARRSLV